MLRKTARRFSEVTEIVLGVFCLGVILLAVMRDDFDRFILGCACLALTVFFYLNKRWGCVR